MVFARFRSRHGQVLHLPQWCLYNLNFKLKLFRLLFQMQNSSPIKMKNLKKWLPVLALILGLGLVMTQSAFKPSKKDMVEYGKIQTVSGIEWVNLSGLTYVDPFNDLEEDQYTCDEIENEYCTAFFDVNDPPQPNDLDPENGTPGEFRPYTAP
ncbi:hypothetical protein D9M68_497400 [compost metagenome]